jgi:hypothetical protein
MLSLLPTAVFLGLAALAAARLAVTRASPPGWTDRRRKAARVLAVAVCAQGAHFLEETFTEFHVRFPQLFGAPPMSRSFFLAFNLAWLAIWVAFIPAVRSGRRVGFLTAWFLAIAGTLNGIGHPVFAVAAGSYFPGLLTSPIIGAAGLWLGFELRRATVPRQPPLHRR